MHIESITLRNFRCFGNTPEECTFEKDLTVFVGSNGAGKTTIIKALQRLFGTNSHDRRLTREDVHFGPKEIAGVAPVEQPTDEATQPTLSYVSSKEIMIDVTLAFPELLGDGSNLDSIPDVFNAMSTAGVGEPLKARIRLEAKWTCGLDEDDIEQKIYWITTLDPVPFGEEDIAKIPMSSNQRQRIQLRYLPATRDGAAIVRTALKELLNWLEKFGDWEGGRKPMETQWKDLQGLFDSMPAIKAVTDQLSDYWTQLFDGKHLQSAKLTVLSREIQKALRDLTLSLGPGPAGKDHAIDELSEGQASLFYIALVATLLKMDSALEKGPKSGFKEIAMLRPWFTIIALEEPENHLAPFYLSRMINLMKSLASHDKAMGILTSHSASALARVEPTQVRHVRQDIEKQVSCIKPIKLPVTTDVANKFIYEAVKSHPELYFAKLVILGEGRSEEIVIPKLAKAFHKDLELDPAFVSFVPLGGRHVNHFWKLLFDLQTPFVTLLDYDLGRYQAGHYRLKYAVDQLEQNGITHPSFVKPTDAQAWKNLIVQNKTEAEAWWNWLQENNVYFSSPLDLDMMMLSAYPSAYSGIASLPTPLPPGGYDKSVFGESGEGVQAYPPNLVPTPTELAIYDALFKKGSKPVAHIEALSTLTDQQVKDGCPPPLKTLFERCAQILNIALDVPLVVDNQS
ncbi:ATP-dependent nuclease [Litorimonas cladophorae]|nr:AAA family ATPase [Litorimonas cladophorae]